MRSSEARAGSHADPHLGAKSRTSKVVAAFHESPRPGRCTKAPIGVSPEEDQSWNGVFSNPDHSILTPTLTENTCRFFIHPEREMALLGRPGACRIGSGPLDDQWSIFSEMFPQPGVCRFVRLIALLLSEWIEGGDENAATLSGGEIESL